MSGFFFFFFFEQVTMLSNQCLEAVLVQGGWILGIMEETS